MLHRGSYTVHTQQLGVIDSLKLKVVPKGITEPQHKVLQSQLFVDATVALLQKIKSFIISNARYKTARYHFLDGLGQKV